MHDNTGNPSDYRPANLVPLGPGIPQAYHPYGPGGTGGPGGMPGDDAPGEITLLLVEFWRVLTSRKWLIVFIAAMFMAFGALATLMTTPLYVATVRLQIDRNVAKIIDSGNVLPVEGSDAEFFRTQQELLRSRAMAERVASVLDLGGDPDFFKPRHFSVIGAAKDLVRKLLGSGSSPAKSEQPPDKAAMTRAAAGIVMGSRTVSALAGSRLVDIRYSDPSPARAQRIAMAYADAFIAANLDKRFEANAFAKAFLEDKIKQAKLRLEESEQTLLDFAQKEQIVVVTEKSSIAENNLASANSALGALVSERIKNEQLWKQVEAANAINLPQLLSNAVIEGLRARRSALVADYQEKLETFKPGYPAMVQIDNKIKEIDRQLATEVKTVKASLKAAYESSRSQETAMKKRIESLREEALDLQRRSIQYNILKREVDTNRSLYDGLLQRSKEVDVAGGSGANNIFVVDRAELPGAPSSPQLSRSLMLSLLSGLGVGVLAAYLLERLDDRVISPMEIERITGLPTLGIIPKVTGGKVIETEFGNPRSNISEAYRSLCASLQFSTEKGMPRTLFITSGGASEGKSFTSLAIARHFAVMGRRVLLVDADLRNPSLHAKLRRGNTIGLGDYLAGRCSPPEAFQGTMHP
ncbi:MAG TPA: exopolysaccharide transport family protein, partial [Hyphomicrobiaceae bacterium]|nr:exopolysaccharide transport family protein [Hyphomicrobiaceae bacterium]